MSDRRKWTLKEDLQLQELITIHGTDWKRIASVLHDRTPKQCRERWINHSGPGIIKGKLTDQEWSIVLTAQKSLGNKWSDIAKLLPGRTPNQIKNMWHAVERKRLRLSAHPESTLNPNGHSSLKRQKIAKEEDFPAYYDEDENSSTTSTFTMDSIVSSPIEDLSRTSRLTSGVITPLDLLVLAALEFYEQDSN